MTAAILIAAAGLAAQSPRGQGRLFSPTDLGLLEVPDRAAWQKPELIMDALRIAEGDHVADIGAGGGAMTIVLGRWIGTGHVFATDITELETIRDYAKREGLNNVTVVEGAAGSTNLPAACCDAIFLRHVYHHITEHEAFNKSLHAALKPGGRLAIIDFVPRAGSQLPQGVPANRGGHGVTPNVVIAEVSAPGLAHVKTIGAWPPGDKDPETFLVLFRK
jgi:ubiquinone/menaquinone biosynthesis C-methylase UbiE